MQYQLGITEKQRNHVLGNQEKSTVTSIQMNQLLHSSLTSKNEEFRCVIICNQPNRVRMVIHLNFVWGIRNQVTFWTKYKWYRDVCTIVCTCDPIRKHSITRLCSFEFRLWPHSNSNSDSNCLTNFRLVSWFVFLSFLFNIKTGFFFFDIKICNPWK